MSTVTQHQPGTLIRYRNRDWMVLPSDDNEILRVKPLGGSEEEQTAIFLPLAIPSEEITDANFPDPRPDEVGDFATAKLLYDAARLSFRNSAGPFRCMGKLSFRPRSYQLVPLVMALKQEVVRLMIADDVGIGKTIEALIILKEMMERGETKKFAVICPPHLCEQWQQEIKDKLDIDAEIIRSSTAAKLDRTIPDDQSIFHHIPFQVISIDYIKADKRRGIFMNDCPDFIIVDEAHTCALPEGSKSKSQQQRHSLLHEIAKNENRHLLLLTATPHSGKDDEFTSLLGLLKPEFGKLNFENIDTKEKKKLAKYFIQRKRENIRRWLNEDTEFPSRDSKEVGYSLSPDFQSFYHNLLKFARGISSVESDTRQANLLRSWAAIALIKGAMSSPDMAVEMLERRKEKLMAGGEEIELPSLEDTLFEDIEFSSDLPRTDLIEQLDLENDELKALSALQGQAAALVQPDVDQKIETTIRIIKDWVKEGHDPIVFCHYIATASYVKKRLAEALGKKVLVEAITSEMADEQRREQIEVMGKFEGRRVLVATDCLSEGINLQEHFTAVLHYDLPWNPNRIEQREGRVDRFGQTAPEIKTYVLYGEDNAMDNFVMDVLIKKVREIQKSIGVSINIGENSKSIMAEAAQKILFADANQGTQAKLFADTNDTITNDLELARRKGENLRSVFAHESIDPEAIKKDLESVDEAIGDVTTVALFVQGAVAQLGGVCKKDKQGYILEPQNLPPHIKRFFGKDSQVKISFVSPTPKGYKYIGRNHAFVEQLCQFLLSIAFEPHPEFGKMARVCEIQTDSVMTRTTLVMFRVRNVIKEVSAKRESVAEEMYLWGYQSVGGKSEAIDYKEAKRLLLEAEALSNLPIERQIQDIGDELKRFELMKPQFVELASQRADLLVESHSRFKELIGGRRYEKATPILPPDVMGVYILMPKPKAL